MQRKRSKVYLKNAEIFNVQNGEQFWFNIYMTCLTHFWGDLILYPLFSGNAKWEHWIETLDIGTMEFLIIN